jgi:hypothetical protein
VILVSRIFAILVRTTLFVPTECSILLPTSPLSHSVPIPFTSRPLLLAIYQFFGSRSLHIYLYSNNVHTMSAGLYACFSPRTILCRHPSLSSIQDRHEAPMTAVPPWRVDIHQALRAHPRSRERFLVRMCAIALLFIVRMLPRARLAPPLVTMGISSRGVCEPPEDTYFTCVGTVSGSAHLPV